MKQETTITMGDLCGDEGALLMAYKKNPEAQASSLYDLDLGIVIHDTN